MLATSLYSRTEAEIQTGTFKGKVTLVLSTLSLVNLLTAFLSSVINWKIEYFDIENNTDIEKFETLHIYSAKLFVSSSDIVQNTIHQIQQDMVKQVEHFLDL